MDDKIRKYVMDSRRKKFFKNFIRNYTMLLYNVNITQINSEKVRFILGIIYS